MLGNLNFEIDPANSNQKLVLHSLFKRSSFTDVTLVCDDGQYVQGHKVVLASISEVFHNILQNCDKISNSTHSLLYLKGIKQDSLLQILDFIYKGKTSVSMNKLPDFMSLAKELKIDGLLEDTEGSRSKVETICDKSPLDEEYKENFLAEHEQYKTRDSGNLFMEIEDVKLSNELDFDLECSKISQESTYNSQGTEDASDDEITKFSEEEAGEKGSDVGIQENNLSSVVNVQKFSNNMNEADDEEDDDLTLDEGGLPKHTFVKKVMVGKTGKNKGKTKVTHTLIIGSHLFRNRGNRYKNCVYIYSLMLRFLSTSCSAATSAQVMTLSPFLKSMMSSFTVSCQSEKFEGDVPCLAENVKSFPVKNIAMKSTSII